MSFRSSNDNGSGVGPVRLSQTTGSPTFRSAAINAVAVIPLLSSSNDGRDDPTTYSSKSFEDFLRSLHRHNHLNNKSDAEETESMGSEPPVVVVVPNSNLTRPGDWKYNETPLRNFHWDHGCQRLRFFDGRPYHSRYAHDRLINHELTRNWIDLCPSRRTAAVIGILNLRDCPDQATLERAIQEWRQWAERYSTPPYEVTALGRDVERDTVVPRLFVYDSFHNELSPNIDLQAATEKLNLASNALVAFPPMEEGRSQVMDLHMNVVVNNLAVAVFQVLEGKIRESDLLMMSKGPGDRSATTPGGSSVSVKTGFFGRSSTGTVSTAGDASTNTAADSESPRGASKDLTIDALANVVGPNSKLSSSKTKDRQNIEKHRSASITMKLENASSNNNITNHSSTGRDGINSVRAQLLTPLDEFWDYSELSPKDAHEMMKREVARREKFAADLSLLAGSPLDAYERYTKAADLCKRTSPDPLWYASALEGCAAAHIAMADCGGFNIDEYLDSSFQLPDEIMACALIPANEKSSQNDEQKKCMPQVVQALCEDALDVTSRHPKTASFHAELLLKLAWYTAELEDAHLRCQWGLGASDEHDNSGVELFGGDPNSEKRRWETASATRLNFLDLKTKEGEDVIQNNTLKRCQKCSEFMHMAVSSQALDPVTRADVALRCVSISWRGIRPTVKPTVPERSKDRIQMKRKAAFFAVAAAEAMSDVSGDVPHQRANAMWIQASRLLSQTSNDIVSGNYGWANLRAVALHALILQGTRESSEDAAKELLQLVSEISPPNRPKGQILQPSPTKVGSKRDSYLNLAGARSYLRESAKVVAKDARSRSKELFGSPNDISSLLVVQSKWVEDDPLQPTMVPMGDLSSDFAHRVLAMPSVWSTIRFENCAFAQEQLVQQIFDLRKNIPASTTLQRTRDNQKLPIEITSIGIVSLDSSIKLERVELKPKAQTKNPAMATFFNPYAKQQRKKKSTTIPRGEEQYISVSFSNKLAIPFEIDSCKLEFDTPKSDQIKAPSISFVIPGQTKNFAVQFPFIILDKLNIDDICTLEVKGIHITALSRSIFLELGEGGMMDKRIEDHTFIPKSMSFYPRRDYSKTTRVEDEKSKVIYSPRLEIIPPQPNLKVSFATSSTPIDDETIIPVLLADGEVFNLPKLCVSNETGLNGIGKIEKLEISAIGLPGIPDVMLYDMPSTKSSDMAGREESKPTDPASPIAISAVCEGLGADVLNASTASVGSSYIAAKLSASPRMGAQTDGCDVTIRFRYRGKAVSPTLEVWRKCEIQIHILRVKGPRISSLSFRCDLFWDSGYKTLCAALASQTSLEQISNKNTTHSSHDLVLPKVGSTDDANFVANRVGQDPGIHVCGDEVPMMVSIANDSPHPITLTRLNGFHFGFGENQMKSIVISKGISARIPIILPRIERSSDVCRTLINMTKFQWKSDIPGSEVEDSQDTGGPMFPSNCRVRQGVLEIPFGCLKNIIDENPIFLSRICKAPCSIGVSLIVDGSHQLSAKTVVGKAVDISATIEMGKWLSDDLKESTTCILKFCCAREVSPLDDKGNVSENNLEVNSEKAFVWIGPICKNLTSEEKSANSSEETPHRARIVFLEEGEYFLSAHLSLKDKKNDDKVVRETWWAEKATTIHVSRN